MWKSEGRESGKEREKEWERETQTLRDATNGQDLNDISINYLVQILFLIHISTVMCICETTGNLVFDHIKYLISALISHTQALAKKEKKQPYGQCLGVTVLLKLYDL